MTSNSAQSFKYIYIFFIIHLIETLRTAYICLVIYSCIAVATLSYPVYIYIYMYIDIVGVD